MPRLTYRYRLYPFGDQAEKLERWIELCRKLYNSALEQRKMVRQMGGKIGYPEQQKELTELRAAFPEYEDVPAHVLQNVLLRLDRAFENFFRRCRERKAGKKVKPGFPRFKGRNHYHSLTSPDKYDYIRNGMLHFPKMEKPIRIEMHRPLPDGAVIKTCTIKRHADGWYATFSLDVPAIQRPIHSGPDVGVDVGLTSFITLSTGRKIEYPKYLRAAERRLKKAQRVLARRKKGSKRRAKQREKVALLHCKIARRRADFQWKTASELAKEFSAIYVEGNLNIKGMARNHRIAKSIADSSWESYLEKQAHAVVKTGARFVKVDARWTTKTCSACGWVWETMALQDRVFRCGKCGLALDRDVNAARNILRVGRDTPEVTLGETRTSAFRYKRKASPVVEPRTVPESAHVA
jgi:putative transposase